MTAMTFPDPRLAKLNGFRVELNAEKERADIVLDRPPLNVIEMPLGFLNKQFPGL